VDGSNLQKLVVVVIWVGSLIAAFYVGKSIEIGNQQAPQQYTNNTAQTSNNMLTSKVLECDKKTTNIQKGAALEYP
jgi:cytoskeletal protein RodZ